MTEDRRHKDNHEQNPQHIADNESSPKEQQQ
jgi:hypothetical protein